MNTELNEHILDLINLIKGLREDLGEHKNEMEKLKFRISELENALSN
ncbi:hypothetical protein [Flavobacterium rhamnosiphilum]|nr:hypothetical protein [Flavobacterium rhamnosiphilum]